MRRVPCHAVPPCSVPATCDPLDDETRPLSRKVSPRHEPLHVRRDRGTDPHPANANRLAGDGQTRNNRRRWYLQSNRSDKTRSLLSHWPLPPLRTRRARLRRRRPPFREWPAQDKPCSNVENVGGQTSARSYST